MSATEQTGLLVLNRDVEIVPVREFPPDIRQRLGGRPTDFIVSDRTSRVTSRRIEEDAAMFLRRFREPRRIVDAVIEHSAELQRDPAQVLAEVYPMVRMLRAESVLVDPDATYSGVLGPGLTAGELFEGNRILECVSDFAETEVYKCKSANGSLAAIKYLRSGSEEMVRQSLSREMIILDHLGRQGSPVAPRLYAGDLHREDPFLCMEWLCGRTLFDLNLERGSTPVERSKVIFDLLETYMSLHRSGVLHGDVHPRNVLVTIDGSVKLIDFGGAHLRGVEDSQLRIGVVQYYEPEVAQAVLGDYPPPQPSELGEQYAVASLAYSVITQTSYLTLSLETDTALDQIANEPPRPFNEIGVTWPAVEAVLVRALSKSPADRYVTFEEFCKTLSNALTMTTPSAQPVLRRRSFAGVPAVQHETLETCCRRFIDRYSLTGDLTRVDLMRGPTASLYAGAGGIAYAFLRVACLQQDPAVLAAADVWISRALQRRHEPLAFTDGSVGAETETGPFALFHSETGLHAIRALIRHSSGDEFESQSSVQDFVESIPVEALDPAASAGRIDSFPLDTTNGAASLLLGATLLMPQCAQGNDETASRLARLGSDLYGIVLQQLSAPPQKNRFLGFAHGRTGALYSLLRWAEVSGAPPHPEVSNALDELAELAQPQGQGLAWPIETADPSCPAWTGWCHGSAGHILTWTTAARVLGRSDHLELAIAAGRHVWESKGQSGPSLCCGSAGEALSLFELARACGDKSWVDRGMALAKEAVEMIDETNHAQGLFRAEAGIALTAAESLSPETSSWPICQSPL